MKEIIKNKFRITSLVLVFSIVISLVTAVPVQAEEILPDSQSVFSASTENQLSFFNDLTPEVDAEETILTEVDTEKEFSDDCVIVTIKQVSSKINKQYSLEDFSDIGCEIIEDLTGLPEDVGDLEYLNFEEFHQILKLTLSEKSKENVVNAIKNLEQREDILCAEPDYIMDYSPCAVPNDTYYSSQWGLQKIQAPYAWNITTGSKAVTVGILDSGIQANHTDLQSNVVGGYDFYYQTSVGYDGDDTGHGTHVAGIIGAKGNNGRGISGVCWDIGLFMMRIRDPEWKWDEKTQTWKQVFNGNAIIRSIQYAIENNIPILNYSGSNVGDTTSIVFSLNNYTGLFVTSAGNEGVQVTPSSAKGIISQMDNVICVAASDQNDNLATFSSTGFSNYGGSTVHLAAPGKEIKSTIPIGSYADWQGTSMAAPFVTGTAALVKSVNPNASTAEIKRTILDNVDQVSALNGRVKTGGRLNAYKAVKNTVIYDDIVTSSANGYTTSYTVTLKNVRFGDGRAPYAVNFPTRGPDGNFIWYAGNRISGTNDYSATIHYSNHSYLTGAYASNIYVYESGDKAISVSRPVHVDLASVDGTVNYDSIQTYSGNNYDSYTMYFKNVLFDNGNSPSAINFPTWSPNGNVVWYGGTRVSGTNDWKVTINKANHNNEIGLYTTHIYFYDSAGNPIGCPSPERVYVGNGYTPERNKLFFDSVTTSSTDNYKSSYTIYVNNLLCGNGNTGSYIQAITEAPSASYKDRNMYRVPGTNNWAVTVKKSDFNNQTGIYKSYMWAHIGYAGVISLTLPTNKVNMGNATGTVVYYDGTPKAEPSGNMVTITLKNAQLDNGNPVSGVEFPTWRTGQSAVWLSGTKLQNTNDWKIELSKSMFGGIAGTYNTHIYAFTSPTNRVLVCGVPQYTLN